MATIHTNSSLLFAQAYGSNAYGCGNYQEGCTTSTTPTPPNTGMMLTEPSIAIPGSLLLAVLIALITTAIARTLRRKRHSRV
jgi:hypothetical protein